MDVDFAHDRARESRPTTADPGTAGQKTDSASGLPPESETNVQLQDNILQLAGSRVNDVNSAGIQDQDVSRTNFYTSCDTINVTDLVDQGQANPRTKSVCVTESVSSNASGRGQSPQANARLPVLVGLLAPKTKVKLGRPWPCTYSTLQTSDGSIVRQTPQPQDQKDAQDMCRVVQVRSLRPAAGNNWKHGTATSLDDSLELRPRSQTQDHPSKTHFNLPGQQEVSATYPLSGYTSSASSDYKPWQRDSFSSQKLTNIPLANIAQHHARRMTKSPGKRQGQSQGQSGQIVGQLECPPRKMQIVELGSSATAADTATTFVALPTVGPGGDASPAVATSRVSRTPRVHGAPLSGRGDPCLVEAPPGHYTVYCKKLPQKAPEPLPSGYIFTKDQNTSTPCSQQLRSTPSQGHQTFQVQSHGSVSHDTGSSSRLTTPCSQPFTQAVDSVVHPEQSSGSDAKLRYQEMYTQTNFDEAGGTETGGTGVDGTEADSAGHTGSDTESVSASSDVDGYIKEYSLPELTPASVATTTTQYSPQQLSHPLTPDKIILLSPAGEMAEGLSPSPVDVVGMKMEPSVGTMSPSQFKSPSHLSPSSPKDILLANSMPDEDDQLKGSPISVKSYLPSKTENDLALMPPPAAVMSPPAPAMSPPAPVMSPLAPVMSPPAPFMSPPAPVMPPPAPIMTPPAPATHSVAPATTVVSDTWKVRVATDMTTSRPSWSSVTPNSYSGTPHPALTGRYVVPCAPKHNQQANRQITVSQLPSMQQLLRVESDLGEMTSGHLLTSTPLNHSSTLQCYTYPFSLGNTATTRVVSTDLTLNSTGSEALSSFASDQGQPSTPNNTPANSCCPPLTPLPSASQLTAAIYQVKESLDTMSELDMDLGRQAHNMKERARRARIKSACEKMRELIPGLSVKTDKATVVEFAVHYIAFLRQVLGGQYDTDFLKSCSPY